MLTEKHLLFEWDDQKNKENKSKHGLDFDTATLVFNDPLSIEIFDDIHSITENRYIVIGKVGRIIAVVYTERGESIRIISARIATKKERDAYYGNY